MQMYPNKYHIEQLGFFHFDNTRIKPMWPIHRTNTINTPQGSKLDDNDRWGAQSFHPTVARVNPDIVWGYGDMWHFLPVLTSPYRNTYRACIYYTIDGQPYYGQLYPDGSTEWGKNLTKADRLVVLSHFGRETLKASCPELKDKDIDVLYYALDTNLYRQRTPEFLQKVKEHLLPKIIANDGFICGWVGRNQFRKQNYKLWEVLHYIVYGDYIQCNDCGRVSIKEWNHAARRTKDPKKYPGELDKLTLYDHNYDYTYCWHCKSSKIRSGTPNPRFYMWLHMPKNDPGYNCEMHERMWNVSDHTLYSSGVNNTGGVPKEDLINLIQTWDCMFYPSGGEGFGCPCQPFDTLVNTTNGVKMLGEISENDSVFTHTGRVKKVTGSTRSQFSGSFIGVKPMFNNKEEFTPNHPVLILKNGLDTGSEVWLRADNIQVGDYLVYPKIKTNRLPKVLDLVDTIPGLVIDGDKVYYPMSFYTDSKYSYNSISKKLGVSITSVYRVVNGISKGRLKPETESKITALLEEVQYKKPEHLVCDRYQNLDEDLMDFFGLYLSEGSICSGGNAIDIAGHISEFRRQELCSRIASRFSAKLLIRTRGNGTSCIISSKILSTLCKNLFGVYSHQKNIPYWFLNVDTLRYLIRGYFDGDGSYNRNSFSASSVSRNILEFIRLALSSYSIYSGVVSEPRLRGKGEYIGHTLKIPNSFNTKFLDLIAIPWNQNSYTKTSRRHESKIVETEDNFYVPVKEVSVRSYSGYVYNMHVDEDHSYLNCGLASHNCLEALACGIPIVYSDYSSHAEIAKHGGLPVRVTYTPELGLGIMRSAVDTNHAVEQLSKMIKDEQLRKSLGNKGRMFSAECNISEIVPVWDRIFTDMMTKPLPIHSENIHATVI